MSPVPETDHEKLEVISERVNHLRELWEQSERSISKALELQAQKNEASLTMLNREAIVSEAFRANIRGTILGISMACAILMSAVTLLITLFGLRK